MSADACNDIQSPKITHQYPDMPKEDVARLLAEAPCHRINWDYHIYAGLCRPIAEKRIAVWVREDHHQDGTRRSEPFWRLAFELRCDLPLIAYDSDGVALANWEQDQVYVRNGAIVFDGGYLEVHDPGLMEPLSGLELTLARRQQTMLNTTRCDPFEWPDEKTLPENFGKSIHLEVDFAAQQGAPLNQPLFYFPQDDCDPKDSPLEKVWGAVCLGEEAPAVGAGARRLVWTIALQGIRSTPYDLGRADARHTLSVAIDYDWPGNWMKHDAQQATPPWFELLVDSLGLFPLRDSEEVLDAAGVPQTVGNALQNRGVVAPQKIDFGTGKRKFTIGAVPDPDGTGLRDAGWKDTFYGRIYSIRFDPNTHCNGC
jgi:hypothetical protein